MEMNRKDKTCCLVCYLKSIPFILFFFFLLPSYLPAQSITSLQETKHVSPRKLRYLPDGEDFVILNGDKKFNRALYGRNSGFRLETGDVPEFALYLPGMGGNLSFGIINGTDSIALNDAQSIESRYRPGSRIYIIKDKLLGNGSLVITALTLHNKDAAIWKIEQKDIPDSVSLSWKFGGASGKEFTHQEEINTFGHFDLKPEYCVGNVFHINKHKFNLVFGQNDGTGKRRLYAEFPVGSSMKADLRPLLYGNVSLKKEQYILLALEPYKLKTPLNKLFEAAETSRKELASRISISTPDPYFTAIGGALSVAAEAIWSGEAWLDGAVGNRMPLEGWRAAYTGNALGQHDRTRKHLDAYAATLSEKKQANDYRMNLCFMDQLLRHLNWTGDIAYARKIWTVIDRHLTREKLNHDPDNDGLYNTDGCIWASNALHYNSGAVTHATAYNYRAYKMAAEIASKIGIDAEPYQQQAAKIKQALNSSLWMPQRGVWAEFQDAIGKKRLHEHPAVWTIYQAIDSDVADSFQAYQATRYIDFEIPHIPVKAEGLKDEGYHTISTTNWMPYSWSINNVAFAEVMHTALAYFQVGRNEQAFKLLKSSILDGMYLGSSPGNFGQLSFYDAAKGECNRDSGDPIGIASRVFVQGLFGLNPDGMNGKLIIRPGFPQSWNHAALKTPDIVFSYQREKEKEIYNIRQNFTRALLTELQLKAKGDDVIDVKANGQSIPWKLIDNCVGEPLISIQLPAEKESHVEIIWNGKKVIPAMMRNANKYYVKDVFVLTMSGTAEEIYDPQGVLDQAYIERGKRLLGYVKGTNGYHTMFVKMKQGSMSWWHPITILVDDKEELDSKLCKSSNTPDCAKWWHPFTIPFKKNKEAELTGYFSHVEEKKCEPVVMNSVFNASVTDIFHKLAQMPVINDSGLRSNIENGVFTTSLGVPFRSAANGRNIAFTSLGDNYPDRISVPLQAKASRAYLLMAGSTNHMQCHIINGTVQVHYTDGSSELLELVNPQNWCPIEQDLYVDGMAFSLKAPRPYRLHLKSGLVSNNLEKDLKIKGVSGRMIDGGAGTLLEIELNPKKELKSLSVETLSNDVTIGLMGITLQR